MLWQATACIRHRQLSSRGPSSWHSRRCCCNPSSSACTSVAEPAVCTAAASIRCCLCQSVSSSSGRVHAAHRQAAAAAAASVRACGVLVARSNSWCACCTVVASLQQQLAACMLHIRAQPSALSSGVQQQQAPRGAAWCVRHGSYSCSGGSAGSDQLQHTAAAAAAARCSTRRLCCWCSAVIALSTVLRDGHVTSQLAAHEHSCKLAAIIVICCGVQH